MSPLELFRPNEFSEWDDDGLPTKDSSGNDITKSCSKKLRGFGPPEKAPRDVARKQPRIVG
ncbi:uncharacterized protein BDCG_16603 [Blastomyces dermatitidis ER-3]|uniref:Uncharacterized protein n=1 Tax=Ajellomyces dermatitidis (strain ER-3 / ATCC MYA-2586) TaxID=559297 RepID=A0ABX2VT44_AJEDR|nr:uncharacterized protein BDCG_16603 [Blastomyces dermatitidis ER-3]OAT00371.1 hypothetical protein BDCG_16603 [Blastomyces dermatitidis ER-3]